VIDPPLSNDVSSPCKRICRFDRSVGFCIGCGRTLDEIAVWSTTDRGERMAIAARAARRLKGGVEPGPKSGAQGSIMKAWDEFRLGGAPDGIKKRRR
jgi:uncharacterized protein